MATFKRLTEVREKAKTILIDDQTRIIIFSDCHRGDYGWIDEFAKNQNLFYYALTYYYNENFTYMELGDGDELWKNRSFADIFSAHQMVFELMSRFYHQDRFHLFFGNHDIERAYPNYVKSTLYSYIDESTGQKRPLFPDIEVLEGLVLKYAPNGQEVFLVHGHQGDLMSDLIWPVGRFFVRAFWKNLQLFGLNDPTSAAKNFTVAKRVDKKLMHWSLEKQKMIIAGHTHRPRYPSLDGNPVF